MCGLVPWVHSNYYQRSLSLSEQVGDPVAVARTLNNMGDIYRQQGQLPTALDHFQRVLSLREQIGNPAALARALHNIGLVYIEQEKWQEALPFLSRALRLDEEMGSGFESYVAEELEALAICCWNSGDDELAEAYYARVGPIREQLQQEQAE